MEKIDGGTRKFRMTMSILVTLIVTALAVFALGRILGEVSAAQVASSLTRTRADSIVLAVFLTAACYVTLSGYDHIALRSLGKPLPWPRTIQGSIAAYALSHNMGFAPVTASYARHMVYSRDGIGLSDVARVVVLTGAAFWLGVILVMGLCLVTVPDLLGVNKWALSYPMQAALGLVIIDIVIVYLLFISRGWKTLGWGKWSVPLPSFRDAVIQGGISLAEIILASAVLWALLPSSDLAVYPLVLIAYVTAFVLVLITHAPGGAGVLEAVVILMLPATPKADVVSALILFRIIFHFTPLTVAIGILALHRRHALA